LLGSNSPVFEAGYLKRKALKRVEALRESVPGTMR
jgi:hypothetical protein